jgi:hypothetical protein
VGLRGVGKTVLLDQMRDDAEAAEIQSVRIEAPENRSLPAMMRQSCAPCSCGSRVMSGHERRHNAP